MVKTSNNKNILVGISAGISAYKTCILVRLLVKDGFSVKVLMTENATKLINPVVFQSLSQDSVYVDMFQTYNEGHIRHISLSQWAKLCVIAPLSANTLSKIANGICDNLLTTVVCALPVKTKVLLAPAMNDNMWKNPVIQKNLEYLKTEKKYIIIPPQKGQLACGVYGEGKMAAADDIYKEIKSVLRNSH
ncbi:MAG: hypothetical protein KBB01_02185 [Candidatus Omnitrophica bacterium]|jgi:phosphopantothenoylcysteine decarboxylase/phosphopantothenate--cysteine ligase|nr:hypothetical protein [Candidatus Omnitrophota bacterium]